MDRCPEIIKLQNIKARKTLSNAQQVQVWAVAQPGKLVAPSQEMNPTNRMAQASIRCPASRSLSRHSDLASS